MADNKTNNTSNTSAASRSVCKLASIGFKRRLRHMAWMLALLLSPYQLAQAKVWQSDEQWSNEWEKKYSQWVADKFTEDFFLNKTQHPQYFAIPHDCADAIYLGRAVFSYENKLPFKVHNPLHKGQYLSNEMTNWDKLPQDERFKKFVNYVSERVGTRTMAADTYPIALKNISAGDMYVEPGAHSYVIKGITDTGVTSILSSSTPASAKEMVKLYAYPFFIPKDELYKRDGYRRFKWPQLLDQPMQSFADYSDEQYALAKKHDYSYINFTEEISKRLRRREESLEEKTERVLHSLCNFAKERVNYVNDGLNELSKIRQNNPAQCMSAKQYDYFSTPSRDRRLYRFFRETEQIAFSGGALPEGEVSSQILARAIFYEEVPKGVVKELSGFCPVAIYPNNTEKYINLRELWQSLLSGRVVSDPHANFEHRWGLGEDKPLTDACVNGEEKQRYNLAVLERKKTSLYQAGQRQRPAHPSNQVTEAYSRPLDAANPAAASAAGNGVGNGGQREQDDAPDNDTEQPQSAPAPDGEGATQGASQNTPIWQRIKSEVFD